MQEIQVVCAIIVNQGKILVAQRSISMSFPMKWEFPGGKIKDCESEEQCIHRELKEELNISVKIEKRLKESKYNYDNLVINLIPFIVRYTGGEIRPIEHHDIKWVSKNNLIHLDWAPADIG